MFDAWVDTRFDKPSLHAMVDLINKFNFMGFQYHEISIESVEPFDGPPLSPNDLVIQTSIDTKALIRYRKNGEGEGTVLRTLYSRILLAAYIYQRVLEPEILDAYPAVVKDYFATTPETAVEDALTYLDSEYGIQLTLQECTVVNASDSPAADGSWMVTVTPVLDHPIWIGPVVLSAALSSHWALQS